MHQWAFWWIEKGVYDRRFLNGIQSIICGVLGGRTAYDGQNQSSKGGHAGCMAFSLLVQCCTRISSRNIAYRFRQSHHEISQPHLGQVRNLFSPYGVTS